ncbi:protein-glutamine gamma-glutamyltransferase K [Amia ocellicauda]|uniref:protein-glutamine gamma-glutamyltransferase K n=1 Tax=Amia ocellicauda TaxID=2972642 RepID=UPI003464E8AB
MPLVTSRQRSAVGRWPSITLVGVEEEPEKEGTEGAESQGRGCSRWIRRMCPCLYPRSRNYVVDQGTSDGAAAKPNKETEMSSLALAVVSVDLLHSPSGQNRKEHHTDHYHTNQLVLRRGQTFQLFVTLSRPFTPDSDRLHLELKTGPLPMVSKGTHVIVPLVEELEDNCWEAKVVEKAGSRIKLSVNSPAKAVIGQYQLTVVTHSNGVEATSTPSDLCFLFNPWCEEDTVFLDDEELRKEYVLNDTGLIYYGTEKQIGCRTWNYGQFDEGILEACLFLLDKSSTPPTGRGDPINVVRVISAMINSLDDSGVLEGDWSGDYTGGTAPTSWVGSVDILRQYHKRGGKPVKYGQCWVFSGVTTTVLRCLGIPGRSVTNFCSAHDTDVSLTTDIYFDENMEPLSSLNSDSIWNFHVWNDCWMARPDLPAGMGGWQAVDATPQETSQGTFCCGPASLTAIRSGLVYLPHDTPFIFAEVNSDKIYWQRRADGTFSQIHAEQKAVGHFISTKAVGRDEREDITELYKFTEGTEEERIAVETACRYGTKPNVYSAPTANDVTIEITLKGEEPRMGENATLTITLSNKSSKPRSTTLHSQMAVMYYTGVTKATVRKDNVPLELMGNEEKTVEWVLPYKDYQDQLLDQAALMLTVTGRVVETGQVLATQHNFRLRTPDLIITPIGDAVVGREMSAKITFTNPLPHPLKDVVFRLEGLGLQSVREVAMGDVGQRATVNLTESFVPTRSGPRKLLASLHCQQLTQVHGVTEIMVQERQ